MCIYFIRLLTGKTITTSNDIYEAMDILYALGCKTIVVSSSSITKNNKIKCIGRNIYSKYYYIKQNSTNIKHLSHTKKIRKI